VNKGKGGFGSFRVTLALSILVGVIVPISMLGEFPEAIKWKRFIFIGILYNGPQNLDSEVSYTWEIKGGGPSGTNAKEVSAFI
jgi:hypothetical protein